MCKKNVRDTTGSLVCSTYFFTRITTDSNTGNKSLRRRPHPNSTAVKRLKKCNSVAVGACIQMRTTQQTVIMSASEKIPRHKEFFSHKMTTITMLLFSLTQIYRILTHP